MAPPIPLAIPSLLLDAAGRVVLPAEVRRRLGLAAGSRLQLRIVAERIELTPETVPSPELATSATGRRVLKSTAVPFDAAAAVREERARQTRRRGEAR